LIPLVIQKAIPNLADQVQVSVSLVSSKIQSSIDSSVGPYVAAMNKEIQIVEDSVNQIIVGSVGKTIYSLEQGIQSLLSAFKEPLMAALGNVKPLDGVVEDYFTCVVGNVTATLGKVEQALQSQGIHLTPITPDQFKMTAAGLVENIQMDRLIERNSIGSGTGLVFQKAVDKLIQKYLDTVKYQVIPFGILTFLGGLLIIMGIVTVLYDLVMNKKKQ
jgi:hypothetical protein